MLKHLYLILSATFILGLTTGAVLYIKNNTGKEGDGVPQVEVDRGFVILAHQYGGCTKVGCPSYRLGESGDYTYIVRSFETEEERFEESLSSGQREKLHDLMSSARLERLQDTEFTGTCPVAYDDVAYRYDIMYEGERYSFDSCTEMLDGDTLFDTLKDYFAIFRIMYVNE